jgi:tRNA threonylcarbamoyladenosine biosynthesis protein TsaB
MKVLALDTATEACSVAVLTDAGIIGMFREVGRGHAEQILDMVDAVLCEAGTVLGRLDGIAAGVGPGSFTGVRIGVSVAQGLAYGAALPVVAVTTLEAFALQAMHAGARQVMACLDARMGEVYWGCFAADAGRGLAARGEAEVGDPRSVKVPLSGAFQGIGRGFAAYPVLRALAGLELPAGAGDALPDAKDVARLGAIRFGMGEGRDPADLIPVYLRDRVALTEAERALAPTQPAPG